jgi:hypothetical protein
MFKRNIQHSPCRQNLSDKIPTQNGLKQGDALSPFFFNFALEYATGRDVLC